MFLVIFRLLLATFVKSQSNDFDAIAHKGLWYGAETQKEI